MFSSVLESTDWSTDEVIKIPPKTQLGHGNGSLHDFVVVAINIVIYIYCVLGRLGNWWRGQQQSPPHSHYN